jgi:signal transduction histidine kinase
MTAQMMIPNGQQAAPPAFELAAIVDAYTDATEKLKRSHERLTAEVHRLSDQLAEKNRELARRERLAALGQMAAGVAHEIRNPLAGLQLFASLLEHDLSAPRAPGRPARSSRPLTSLELVRKISSAVRNLDAIVNDILAFAGEATIKPVPVQTADLIRDVVGLASPQADKHGVTVHVYEPPPPAGRQPAHGLAAPDRATLARATQHASRTTHESLLAVLADAGQLQRALLNLVRNAIEAAGAGGNVWVRAEPSCDDPPRVRISVADDGPGVAEGLAQRIFNPFFTTRSSGTGLGLSIVHRIIEAHGGAISVTRREEGGAVFTITLPAAVQDAPSPESV